LEEIKQNACFTHVLNPKSILAYRNCKTQKKPYIPKGNRQQPSAHHVAKTEEKLFASFSSLKSTLHSLHATIFVSYKIMLLIFIELLTGAPPV
jgi:hypothetical protein